MKTGKISVTQQYRRMLETPIPRLVTQMAIPSVISMLITVVYNTADTFFVSQIDKSAAAAVGAVYAIMAVIQALGYGLGMGAGSLISRRLGAKKNEEAERFASAAFFAAIAVGFLITVGGIFFLDELLALLRCTGTMLPHARPYALYILLAAPINCAQFVLNNTLRSQGFTTAAMVGIGTGGVLNIILDPILIFGAGMGAGGAALATMISQTVGFLILGAFFLCGRSIVRIRLRYMICRPREYGAILSAGLPTICRQGLGSIAAAVLNVQAIGYGGDVLGAAVTISNKLYILVRNIILGLGQGFQPVAGYNFGAGDRRRTWRAFAFTTVVGTVICCLFAAVSLAFAEPIMWWFCKDAEVARIGARALLFCAAAMPVLAFGTYVNQTYQCLGFQKQGTFLASCRQGIFFLPAVLFLPRLWGQEGVIAAQPIADLCTALISVPFLIFFYRRYIRGRVCDKNCGGGAF